MSRKKGRKASSVREVLAQPSLDSKRRRDSIRARWRKVIVEDFRNPSAFRHAWPSGSQGQRTAETVYGFLQNQKRSGANETHADLKLATILAFAEMTGRSLSFLLTGKGPERDGEVRTRAELVDDVAATLTGAIPSALRDVGLHVDGTSAMAFVFIKVQAMCEALEPLVKLGTIVDAQFLLPAQKKQLVNAVEAASRQATAEIPGLLTFDGRTLLHTTLNLRGKPHPNPALRRTVEDSYRIADLNAEASQRALNVKQSAAYDEHD